MYQFFVLFLLFIIYSMLGYIAEIIFCTIQERKLIYNRGFLIGPYLPIYGVGALLILFFLNKYSNDLVVLFVMSVVYCAILEYLTSLVLEKIFHLRWWDYSDMKFNLNGRVCLLNGVLFGIGGVMIVKVIHPIVNTIITMLPPLALLIISTIIFGLFIADLIISLRIMCGLKYHLNKFTNKDATSQIKNEVNNFLSNYSVLTNRLLKSFPELEKLNGSRFKKFLDLFDKVKKELIKIKDTKILKRHK